MADSHCDPKNNHPDCAWDGGDCCGPTEKGKAGRSKFHFCTADQIFDKKDANGNVIKKGDCTCKDPKYVKKLGKCEVPCFATKWAGDGNCDDHNNVCGCNWDGGDCCGKNRNFQFCTHCGCRDPNHKKSD